MGVHKMLAVFGVLAMVMVASARADKESRKVSAGQWFGLAPVNVLHSDSVLKTEEGYVLVMNGDRLLFQDVRSLEMFLNDFRAGR